MSSMFGVEISYIVAAICFVIGLKMLGSPRTARRGNLISAGGMLVAIVVTLMSQEILTYQWIIIGILVGSVIGFFSAKWVAMTQMPEMVAIFNGFGGIASLLVGWAAYQHDPQISAFTAFTIYLSVLIGGITFTGSVIAFIKLAELWKKISAAVVYRGQQIVNGLLLVLAVVLCVFFCYDPTHAGWAFLAAVALSFVLGVLVVIPIGGADMPVVIALLNSYSGLAACAAGFVIQNNILIVAGSLVGASGIILTGIMCKAMNRSLANVLFSGFGSTTAGAGKQVSGEMKASSVEDAYYVLEAARSVVIVPGYGMAVAQAQHIVRELAELLENNGAEVRFGIHPVAGRMPGHMNVLLAEANVPYDQLAEMDDINPLMETVDVAIVIGANDVVNPSAIEDESSPIYGMPIINVHKARTVYCLKRGAGAGFAGIQNPLFFRENTRMLFGDAKQTVSALVGELKETGQG